MTPRLAGFLVASLTLAIDQANKLWLMDVYDIAARQPGLRGIHDFRTRRSGTHDFAQFHMEVDPRISVAAAHDLVEGVEALAAHRHGRDPNPAARAVATAPPLTALAVDMVLHAAEAFAAPSTELVPWSRAQGRIAAEIIAPAPPGVPRLIPGQRITPAHVAYLQANVDAGAFILDTWTL